MRNKVLMFLTAVLVMVSCEEKIDYKKEFNTLFDKTIKLHDEAMAKMGVIAKYQMQCEVKVRMGAEEDVTKYKLTLQELNKAHSGMMKWMHRFSDDFPYEEDRLHDKTDDEIIKETESLKPYNKEIEEVQKNMDAAIAKAEALFKEE
ncbi:hypothetical protein NBRC110019_16670 [Neptunitalea chrysea]|uniref:Uncharacterized protein n=1 Tax=Neptunitalea chrysea TaxID=1647581 RepID=A0A9W6EVK9_9FLAO|nr:hypothetical protein [Neptunitalea chrysea]GLB52627.1 hypothetical protein NBRC110019_16670 [Neptunitalea chrysea]